MLQSDCIINATVKCLRKDIITTTQPRWRLIEVLFYFRHFTSGSVTRKNSLNYSNNDHFWSRFEVIESEYCRIR